MNDEYVLKNNKRYVLTEVKEVAKAVIAFAKDDNVWVFEGELGAGKTTLIQAIAIELGISLKVTSPTYSMINEYTLPNGSTVYHFDCYRLTNEIEAYEIGAYEYLNTKNLCWVEWPEKILSLLPPQYTIIKLEAIDAHTRNITYAKH